MDTSRKAISAAAKVLALSIALLGPGVAAAGSLSDLANSVRKGNPAPRDSTAHAAPMRLSALRPNLPLTQAPQVSLDAPRQNAVSLHEAQPRLPSAEAAVAGAHGLQGLHFEDASATVNPNLIRMARNYHHDGLPVVKLWQADRNMVSVGLNPHGVPGIFFTQALGK
jgi:hypothetical protein